jgi:hypothetical protein
VEANEKAYIDKELELGGEALKDAYDKLLKAKEEFVTAQEKEVPLEPNNY